MNQVLDAIKDRRTILRFEEAPVEEDKIQAILEAGRWAPSWLNRQPWRFILIEDQSLKRRISQHVPTVFNLGINEAPISIIVCVDSEEDPYHFIEDGAASTQNMALAAHSLGLGSCWIGVFNVEDEKGSSEEKIKEILSIPKNYRVISVLPIGIPKYFEQKDRKKLSTLLYRDGFQESG
ncbi:MAG: nitroreductase family protein [Desulfobacterales bacterium]|nr:nitroreductase family protein [Desulfobacterales bacterium]